MGWDVARAAIDLAFRRSDARSPFQIGFFGGEPLLEFPLLQACVARAESTATETGKTVRMAITTNGLALDAGRASYLQSHDIEPTLSFDGVPEAHDASRSYCDGRSSFHDTEEAMHLLRGLFPDLAICAVVSPENVACLPASIDYFLDAGITHLLLNPNFFAPWDAPALDLWRRGYEHAADRFERACGDGRPVHINFLTAKIVTHLKGGYDPCDCCDFGGKEIAVAPSGNIYPCQRMVGEDTEKLGCMGNVFTGIEERACADIAHWREVTSPECAACDLRRRCRNWCSCVNQRLTGRFDRVGPLVCLHERMAIEIADRVASRLFERRDATFLETFYFEKEVAPEWV